MKCLHFMSVFMVNFHSNFKGMPMKDQLKNLIPYFIRNRIRQVITPEMERKIQNSCHYLIRKRYQNIYHCCIHKSASQWFRKFFNDPVIWRHTRLISYHPDADFTVKERKTEVFEKLKHIPGGSIVTPLYIRDKDFREMMKPEKYKAFYVMRDPRDVLVSDYFSAKYSHPVGPGIPEMRKRHASLSTDEGIMEFIETYSGPYYDIMLGWVNYAAENDNVRVFRFEDLFGPESKKAFLRLLDHCEMNIPHHIADALLDKYNFEKISGRKPGIEDIKNHYRKGISGDWKNYFSEAHKTAFKKYKGQLLIELGYETDLNW